MNYSNIKVVIYLCASLLSANINLAHADKPKVDIIFAMDTSGSMDDEGTALVNSMNSVITDLSNDFDLSTKLWGITATDWGLTSYVRTEVANATSNDSEDWGPATYDLSALYTGWRSGAIKIIVPISDECPENGDSCNSDDDASIVKARNAADLNGVEVLPIIGSPYNAGNYTKIKQLGFSLSTSNKIILTSSNVFAEEMKNAINEIVATVTGNIVLKPVFGSYSISGTYINIPLSKAPGATGIQWEVYENGALIDGQSTTSIDKISIRVTDVQTHEYEVRARSVGVDSTGTTIYSDYAQTTAKYIGLFTNLVTECATTPSLPQCLTQKEKIKEEPAAENPATPVTKVETRIGEVSDPVDITTGNFSYSHTDISIKTAGIPIVIKRYYNSLDIQRGWGFNIVNTIDISDLNNIKVSWGSGQTESFVKSESGWNSKYGTSHLYTESGFYTVELSDKTKFRFSLDGKLKEVLNKKGLGYKYTYTGTDISITDSFDNALLTINRDNSNQVTSIVDVAGNTAEYTYIGTDISAYKNRNGDITTYEYDADNIMYKIIGADNNAYVENTYDSKGRTLTQKDGAGEVTQFSYDVDENTYIITKSTVTYPDGSTQEYSNEYNRVTTTSVNSSNISYEYDANGKISKLTDQDGKSWEFKRNGSGQLTEYKDPLGNTYKYSYDSNGNLIQTENPEAKKVNFEYDANQNLTKITYPDSSTKTFTYNANNQLVSTVNQLGNTTSYEYDLTGFISKITLPNTGEMKYLYTALGQVNSVEDPLGNKITYTYDNEGKITKKTDALNNSTSYLYNTYGDLIEVTNAKGDKTLYEYNTDGLKTKATFSDAATIEYKYDVLGRLIETKDKLGRIAKKEYDSFGRLAKTTTPNGKFVEYKYDKVGNLTAFVDEKGNELTNEFNELGQATKKYDALSNLLTEKAFNALGLPTVITDGLGKNSKFQYDSLNRLISSTLSDGITASATYDAMGQVKAVTDPKGYQTLYEYDALGNPVKETNPLGESTAYSYDLYGRVTQIIEPNQTQLNYEYDAEGNITKLLFKKGTNEEAITYSYDQLYKPTLIKNALGEVKYSYDSMSRVTQRVDVYGNTLDYTYDAIGRLMIITYPDGKKVNYEYNNDDQLVKITDFSGNITTYEYGLVGKLIKVTYPNNFYTNYEYDSNHKLILLQNFDKNGKVVTANTLARNTIGDITEIERTEQVAIDLSKISSTNFTVNEANQIISNGNDNFTYDKNGNLLDYKIDGKAISFTYGLRGKTSTATIGTDNFTYQYDAEGNRVELTKNSQTTRFVIDNVLGLQKPLVETDSNNAIKKYYIYGNGLVYSVDANGVIGIYLYDYKGSTTAIVDKTGKVQNAYTYSAYGKTMGSRETVENRFKYLGKYGVVSDSDNHLYVRARNYSSDLGRFTQADKIRGIVKKPLSLNRYRYTDGDPTNYFDINGYLAMYMADDEGAAGAGHGAVAIQNRETGGWDVYSWGFTDMGAGDWGGLAFGKDVDGKLSHYTLDKKFTGQEDYFKNIFAQNNSNENGGRYDELFIIETTLDEERLMKQHAETVKKSGRKYDLYKNNCMQVAIEIINKGLEGRDEYQLKRKLEGDWFDEDNPDDVIKTKFSKQNLSGTKRKAFANDWWDTTGELDE